ncbi:Mannose-1-phosphate guanylyltransferase (GDP) [Granulicella sibirica]|uniref:Mannose-1-phosphate guanylyltransferase (GDP) n=2 Tax=Granulicella sibirica TaxID=2479048 RepID=A0A4V1L600_9BACT|nr:Mannose-1-phosphate guanylyltransferase (GDP) [Granulicella sibirica]
MIQQTLERLLPVASAENVWVITNHWLHDVISEQLPGVPAAHVISEPCPRNTAPACALSAFLLERNEPDTVIGIFPSDHVVSNIERFAEVLATGIRIAAAGENIVVLGVPPTRPETGYGYIEQGDSIPLDILAPEAFEPPETTDTLDGATENRITAHRVRRFREKPDGHTAERFLSLGNYVWNGGIFLWSARTLANAIREHIPDMAPPLEAIAAAYGTPDFEKVFAEQYPLCENISIDYAVLEPRSGKGERRSAIFSLPADFGWNDLGSWASLHEHRGSAETDNVVDGATTDLIAVQSKGNYVHAPGRMVALLGVEDLVVVETPDALLITTRGRSQDVSKIVRAIHESGREDLI